jgi:hypothetical protein
MGFLFVLVQKYWIFTIWAPIFISLEQIIDKREKDSGGGGSGSGSGSGGGRGGGLWRRRRREMIEVERGSRWILFASFQLLLRVLLLMLKFYLFIIFKGFMMIFMCLFFSFSGI